MGLFDDSLVYDRLKTPLVSMRRIDGVVRVNSYREIQYLTY